MKSSIKAMTRIVHLNLEEKGQSPCLIHDTPTYPTSSINFLAAIGMIVPPSEDPVALKPNANNLRFLNHCAVMVGTGPKTIPQASPVSKPWQRSNCQNSWHSAVITVATTRITLVFGPLSGGAGYD